MNKATILIVDDEEDILELLRYNLTKEGYRVVCAESGEKALAEIRRQPPDVVILDLMLPGVDGLDVCREVKAGADTAGIPIIMLTARTEEADRLIGLELGADDYITKPFSPRELVARVRAVLRRVQGGVLLPAGLLRAGGLEMDLAGHRVTRAGETVQLTRSEFDLLAVLMQHPGQTLTRAQLLDRLHGIAYDGFDRSVDAHIKNLRRKLEADPLNPRYVLTVYGVGYKFTDEA